MLAPSMTADHGEQPGSISRSLFEAGQVAGERLYSFRVYYVAIFVFLLLYLFTIGAIENALDAHFQTVVDQAIVVTDLDRPISAQIDDALRSHVDASGWVRWGGVEVTTLVLASDRLTWLYVDGHEIPQPEGLDPTDVLRQAVDLLPAQADVSATLPHNALFANAVLIFYAAVLLQFLYLYTRASQRRDSARLEEALAARDATATRTAQITSELEALRARLQQVEPAEREHGEEIRALQRERVSLQSQLERLAAREEELRGTAAQAVELSQEVSALEDLLEEAGADLAHKNEAIRDLEQNLKKVARGGGGGGKRSTEQIARRLRTLYKGLEIDDRAIDDMIALRDEVMQLKAEEKLKRLEQEADNVAVRRKVGGLPDQLSVFELGFAGKGRIYYTRGNAQRFRILAIGAKNSQDADLDYLRRHLG